MRLSNERLEQQKSTKKYCICNRQTESSFMICCDYCNIWFHGSCVQVTKPFADCIDKYGCPLCVSIDPSRCTIYKNGTRTPSRRKTPSVKSTPRKYAQVKVAGTPTGKNQKMKVDFSENDNAEPIVKSSAPNKDHKMVIDKPAPNPDVSPVKFLTSSSNSNQSMINRSPFKRSGVATATDTTGVPGFRFSITPAKEMEECKATTSGIINYIAQSSTKKMDTRTSGSPMSVDDPKSPDKDTTFSSSSSSPEPMDPSLPETPGMLPGSSTALDRTPSDSDQPLKESAVLDGYFADFREKNGCASRLMDFLMEEDSDDESNVNHRLEKKLCRTSEISPDKKMNSRYLINIPETPEEKLRERHAVLKNVGNEDAQDEVVPQTPIGKIKRESIGCGGKSRLNVLLKENDNGSAPASNPNRKRHHAQTSARPSNPAKRSLFR